MIPGRSPNRTRTIPKILKALIAGVAGTAVMTAVMKVGPMMRMPKMDPAATLAMMMGFPLAVGWMLHFMIGIVFDLAYALLFMGVVRKVSSPVMKGVLFGLLASVFAQAMMSKMGGMLGGMPLIEVSMMLMVSGSIQGHVVFGIVVAFIVKEDA